MRTYPVSTAPPRPRAEAISNTPGEHGFTRAEMTTQEHHVSSDKLSCKLSPKRFRLVWAVRDSMLWYRHHTRSPLPVRSPMALLCP